MAIKQLWRASAVKGRGVLLSQTSYLNSLHATAGKQGLLSFSSIFHLLYTN
jgi:hypothetical protein